MPKLPGKTSTAFQLRASRQGSNNNNREDRVRAIENFMADRENFVVELQSYVSQILHHFDFHPEPLPVAPSIAATTLVSHQLENSTNVEFRAIENSIAIVRGYLQQLLHNLGLHPQLPLTP
ncbi:uncharacterized protein G2W53_003315 [Senna tora]|uniref:Uncharacterized protein n=1 Tax=Senna tora TaxID=362788 RepID=A0A834XAM8_9FABA|nr:uncharacterized protein G2W53_003315 [Senna tora]